MKPIHGLLTIAALAAIAGCTSQQTPEKRAKELVSKLTIEQKASLMMHASSPVDELGIPAYNWWNEALHGVARNGKATVFPTPVGMAASFDEPLVYEVFTAVSDEARVKNRQALREGEAGWYQGLTFWTPNINIFRDPRWGRGLETYGEDPYLTGRLGTAVVCGLQGPADARVLKAHACAKHFAVHSGPEWNRHSFNAEVSERDLRETYLPAFKDLVTKAGVQEVMIAYNRFRGEPCGASDYLVNTILRGEWGYKGIVLSDCWALADFHVRGRHEFTPDAVHTVAAAIRNGVDLECGDTYVYIPEAVAAGLLKEEDVDRSLVRLLAARIRLGELDGDISDWDRLPDSIVEGEENRALSLKMAEETLVLLQNRGGILPLAPDAKIALLGPNGDDREMMWGNYNPIPEHTVTLADALRERFPCIKVIKGCDHFRNPQPMRTILKALDGIDTVIFAGGISPLFEGEEMSEDESGRGADRRDIELPAVQREMIAALRAAGKKVILVNFSGSAIGLEPETRNCEAILQAWYPGEEGGTAIANVLYGKVSPSGKLPVTFYRNAGQLPDFENYDMKGRTYRFFEDEPLFPFGYGLSYASFEYGEPSVSGRRLTVSVTNTGSVAADETVQFYVRKTDDTEGPLKTLRGFRRINLAPGESKEVSFDLTDETFLWWNEKAGDMTPAAGEWELMVGGASDQLRSISFKR